VRAHLHCLALGLLGLVTPLAALSCGAGTPPEIATSRPAAVRPAPPIASSAPDAGGAADAESLASAADATADAAPARTDPMALHAATHDELLALMPDLPGDPASSARARGLLGALLGVSDPAHMNQGNRALAQHTTSREECMAGLAGIVLQTDAQRATCGADNMVPVWAKGKAPSYCIDLFEFPNKACELPVVWTSPSTASAVCKLQGKRLCTQSEWQLACRADPEGGPDRRYAYGDVLDLDVCHTNRPHRQRCDTRTAATAWASCTTDTEPSGAFPRCRSRFGVFDQHGNVAEEMTRIEPSRGGEKMSQLKGSAWFYMELAQEPGRPVPETTRFKDMAHPDHCNFDPRWHVETLDQALHVNYHLGFRCCKSL
jgi:formylglycine-generating enzyme